MRFHRRRRAAALAEALGLEFGKGQWSGYYVFDPSLLPYPVLKRGSLGDTLRYMEAALDEATGRSWPEAFGASRR